jgi:hypothetical protein
VETPAKRERAFDLSLPVFIQGLDAGEREIAENGEVSSMSAEEAILKLRSHVRVGAKLQIDVHVPRTFFLENPIEVKLTGTVIQAAEAGARRRGDPLIRLRLDPIFAIQSRPA